MMKYVVGLGALVVVVIGYFLLAPATPPDPVPAPEVAASDPEPAPAAVAPATPETPEAIISQDVVPVSPDDEALLETMAADARESLPSTVTDTLTMTDALFLPRMRIMEYSYVTTAVDARASARDMRTLIEARAERLCLAGRQMFAMGVTLRNSFEDRDGNLFQRVYLLPEDCEPFF
ncbi:hypothetical protein [Yoonia vestfoldensis]|jgi:hypothetical protein|uniref:hypothetical protein n=1 Tax=Yoonia vestfoldensis TaxID=245188 RepID=UPI0003A9B551|nr:hypothetical protein [Yoonia vestfoldensis]